MLLEDDFMWVTSRAFSEMRLLVEGALNRYEDDTAVLLKIARAKGKLDALDAMDDIGTALYALNKQIKKLQLAHREANQYPGEFQRDPEDDNENT